MPTTKPMHFATDNIDYHINTAKEKKELEQRQQQYKECFKVVSATFLLVCFVYLKDSTCETRKSVFYFTSKTLFVLEIIQF